MEINLFFVFLQVLLFVTDLTSYTIYNEDAALHLVFIYGVMKRGEPMHHWLLDPAHGVCRYVTKARTVQQFPMVIATKYNVPVVIYHPDMGHNIEGELFEMNLPMIKKLDKYVYLPNEIIARIEIVSYNDTKTNSTVKKPAIIYVKYYTTDDQWMKLPFLVNYHSKGAHGLEFRERQVKKKKKKAKKSLKNKKKKSGKRKDNGDKDSEFTQKRDYGVNGNNCTVNKEDNMKRKNTTEDIEGDIRRKIRRAERSYNKSLITKAPLYRDSSMF